jgi:hypothetical protein
VHDSVPENVAVNGLPIVTVDAWALPAGKSVNMLETTIALRAKRRATL